MQTSFVEIFTLSIKEIIKKRIILCVCTGSIELRIIYVQM